MLALAEYRGDTCPGCGGQLTETAAPENEGKFQVALPHRCHRCTAIAAKQAEYKDSPHPFALLWSAFRRR